MAKPVEIHPLKNGKWKVSDVRGSFEERAEAVRAAKKQAGAEELYDKDGSLRATTRPDRPIWLFSLDGTLVGELADAPAASNAPIEVQLEPAGESSNAEGVG